MNIVLAPKCATWSAAIGLIAATTLPVYATSSCSELSECERKICEKRSELDEALQYNDFSKAIAIQHSIVKVTEHCAYSQTSQSKMLEKQQQIAQDYNEDLQEALDDYQEDIDDAEGKPDKIARAKQKYQAKVDLATDKYQSKQAAMGQ